MMDYPRSMYDADEKEKVHSSSEESREYKKKKLKKKMKGMACCKGMPKMKGM